MIDYYAAYSFYALLVIASTIACIIAAALFSAFMFAKLSKNVRFFVWIAAVVSFLCLPVARFMVLVSPSVQLLNKYINFQRNAAIFSTGILMIAGLEMLGSGIYKKAFYGLGMVFAVHSICVFYLIKNSSRVFSDFMSILDFTALSLFMIILAPDLFTEFSPVSIDKLMKKNDDIIFIFGENGKLIDATLKAKALFPFIKDGLPVHEFIENIQKITISKQHISINNISERHKQGELDLLFSDGVRCFQFSITQVKRRRANRGAVVINFYDTTDICILQKELEEKNSKLEKLNSQLEEFLETEEILMEEEHKANAVRQLRETIGMEIEKLISEIKSVEPDEQHQKLPALIDSCREVMAGVRSAVQKLMPNDRRDE